MGLTLLGNLADAVGGGVVPSEEGAMLGDTPCDTPCETPCVESELESPEQM